MPLVIYLFPWLLIPYLNLCLEAPLEVFIYVPLEGGITMVFLWAFNRGSPCTHVQLASLIVSCLFPNLRESSLAQGLRTAFNFKHSDIVA